jgi:hypothetical protein
MVSLSPSMQAEGYCPRLEHNIYFTTSESLIILSLDDIRSELIVNDYSIANTNISAPRSPDIMEPRAMVRILTKSPVEGELQKAENQCLIGHT